MEIWGPLVLPSGVNRRNKYRSGEEIAVLDSDISGFQSEMQAATEIREKEKADYKVERIRGIF